MRKTSLRKAIGGRAKVDAVYPDVPTDETKGGSDEGSDDIHLDVLLPDSHALLSSHGSGVAEKNTITGHLAQEEGITPERSSTEGCTPMGAGASADKGLAMPVLGDLEVEDIAECVADLGEDFEDYYYSIIEQDKLDGKFVADMGAEELEEAMEELHIEKPHREAIKKRLEAANACVATELVGSMMGGDEDDERESEEDEEMPADADLLASQSVPLIKNPPLTPLLDVRQPGDGNPVNEAMEQRSDEDLYDHEEVPNLVDDPLHRLSDLLSLRTIETKIQYGRVSVVLPIAAPSSGKTCTFERWPGGAPRRGRS